MLRLLHAASNVDIARKLGASWFRDLLTPFTSELNADRDMRTNAKRLLARTQGWTVLEDAFSNTQGDYIAAADMLKDVGMEEQSFGIWLESAIAHGDVASSLAENPVLSVALPRLFSHRPTDASPSQDEFVAFVRAYIGVACVLAVYAWSDSLPDERCRARVLGILRLWQGVDGYREVGSAITYIKDLLTASH